MKIDEVRSAMVAAMKAGDKPRKESLSMLLSALKAKAIDKREDLTPEEEIEVVMKELRQTKETLETSPSDRTEVIEQCKARIAVLSEFAPQEMTVEEIKEVINSVLANLAITEPSAKDKGKIMKDLMPLVKGKADGKLVNQIVGELFS